MNNNTEYSLIDLIKIVIVNTIGVAIFTLNPILAAQGAAGFYSLAVASLAFATLSVAFYFLLTTSSLSLTEHVEKLFPNSLAAPTLTFIYSLAYYVTAAIGALIAYEQFCILFGPDTLSAKFALLTFLAVMFFGAEALFTYAFQISIAVKLLCIVLVFGSLLTNFSFATLQQVFKTAPSLDLTFFTNQQNAKLIALATFGFCGVDSIFSFANQKNRTEVALSQLYAFFTIVVLYLLSNLIVLGSIKQSVLVKTATLIGYIVSAYPLNKILGVAILSLIYLGSGTICTKVTGDRLITEAICKAKFNDTVAQGIKTTINIVSAISIYLMANLAKLTDNISFCSQIVLVANVIGLLAICISALRASFQDSNNLFYRLASIGALVFLIAVIVNI